jgi:hypothetical protein
MKLIITISILMTIQQVSLNCTQGCLKCNLETEECMICDLKNNFILDVNGICQKVIIKDCQYLNSTGSCIKYYSHILSPNHQDVWRVSFLTQISENVHPLKPQISTNTVKSTLNFKNVLNAQLDISF